MSDVCEKITMKITEGEPEMGVKVKELLLTDGQTSVIIRIPVDSSTYETEVLMIARGIQRAVLTMKKYRIKKFMEQESKELTTINRCV